MTKTEIEKDTEEQMKKLSPEEIHMQATLNDLVNLTHGELLKLAKPVASASNTNRDNLFYKYNMNIFVKYCHLAGGVWHLLQKNNYFSSLIVLRAMLEIKFHLRYFNLHPSELKGYNESDGNNPKFQIRKIILDGHEDDPEVRRAYDYYRWLCSITHPAEEPTSLLAVSETKTDENSNLLGLFHFNPTYNKTAYMHGLTELLLDNIDILRIEYVILKSIPGLEPNLKLIKNCSDILEIFANEITWGQKGIREHYAKMTGRKFEEINKPFAELEAVDKINIKKFLKNLLPTNFQPNKKVRKLV